MEQETSTRHTDRVGSAKSAVRIVGLCMLSFLGCCLWAMEDAGERGWKGREERMAHRLPFANSDHALNLLDDKELEKETISCIHEVVEEHDTGLPREEERRLASFIYHEGYKHGLDPFLLVAIIQAESRFRNFSISSRGAKGLMQILPSVGRAIAAESQMSWEGDRTLFNPKHNIRLGASYLKKLLEQFDDLHLALTAYNYGPEIVMNKLKSGKRMSSLYAKKVLTNYSALQERTRDGKG